MPEYIIRPLFNWTCRHFNRRENLALAGLHEHVAVILKTRKARFGLTSSCLCRNIPDVSRFLQRSRDVAENGQTPLNLPFKGEEQEPEPIWSEVSPKKGRFRGVYSLRSLCASAMQLTGFCEQKLICGLGNNAGSKERTYRHYLTRQILRQSLRVALCEKQEWMVFKNISYHFYP